MRRAWILLSLAFVGLSCASRSYLDTDVAEPADLGPASATDVHVMGSTMTSGTLTYEGKGSVQATFEGYVKAQRAHGWEPRQANGDAARGITCVMTKDTRTLDFSVTPGTDGTVKIVIQVGPSK